MSLICHSNGYWLYLGGGWDPPPGLAERREALVRRGKLPDGDELEDDLDHALHPVHRDGPEPMDQQLVVGVGKAGDLLQEVGQDSVRGLEEEIRQTSLTSSFLRITKTWFSCKRRPTHPFTISELQNRRSVTTSNSSMDGF